ncbi:unnamed protein product [Euphydryas editha]|uniref:Fucosyltransferase n=1 Tax=Euphydryas editha TaxID=104508 RepID=A0AAU9TJY8_EUPED|nr:unnamed protein product [Euphydryas editha]
MAEGNLAFLENKCPFANCLVTDDSYYFSDISQFDAILFLGRDISNIKMPSVRSPKQVYVFAAQESSANYPLCDEYLDGFFNLTWTYRIDSDLYLGYFTILDLAGNVVGPAIDMKWPDVLEPTCDELKIKLRSKSKLAAWFVSHCSTLSDREGLVEEVQEELRIYGLSVDIYGTCGTLTCPTKEPELCYEMIERDYYFYFALENSFAEDYVTEKLLTALNNFAVPVVYGGANYSRFLPPGSYLDGRELGAKELVNQMIDAVNNMTKYYDFFRWTNHYVYENRIQANEICKFCEIMNDERKISDMSVRDDFRRWWNDENYYYNCLE